MPRQVVASSGRRRAINTKITDEVRAALEAAAAANDRTLSGEIELRLEQGLAEQNLIKGLLGSDAMSAYFRAQQHILGKILRVALRSVDDFGNARTPFERELSTRREMAAAMEVLNAVYMATEAPRPRDPEAAGQPRGAWGSGWFGRKAAYDWLEWESNDALDDSKGSVVYAVWTGNGEKLGDLVEAGLLTQEQASKRMFPEGEPTPLVMPRDAIPVSSAPRPSDSGPDVNDSEASGNAPVQKPKRARKAKPQT